MAPADFSFRSHHSFHLSLKNSSAHRAVSTGHLSGARTEKCHRQQFWPRENPTFSWFSLDLVRSYAVPFVATFSLGAGSKNRPQSQAVRRRHGNSFHSSRSVGSALRPGDRGRKDDHAARGRLGKIGPAGKVQGQATEHRPLKAGSVQAAPVVIPGLCAGIRQIGSALWQFSRHTQLTALRSHTKIDAVDAVPYSAN